MFQYWRLLWDRLKHVRRWKELNDVTGLSLFLVDGGHLDQERPQRRLNGFIVPERLSVRNGDFIEYHLPVLPLHLPSLPHVKQAAQYVTVGCISYQDWP